MSKSPNLGLNLTPELETQKLFKTWRIGLDGDVPTSNMMILDEQLSKVAYTTDEQPSEPAPTNTDLLENKTRQSILDEAGTAAQEAVSVAVAEAKTYTDTKAAVKVDKVDGKGLSTNDYTTVEKNKLSILANYNDTAVKQLILQNSIDDKAYTDTKVGTKVDKVTGMGLSSNDYTAAEKAKLAGLNNYNDTEIKQSVVQAVSDSKAYADTKAETKVDKVVGKELSSNDYTSAEKTKLASGVATLGSDGKVLPSQLPTKQISAILTAGGWSGSIPFTQSVGVVGMTADTNGSAGLSVASTAEQREAARNAMLCVTSQDTGVVTVTADGEKPSIAIPISITILGVG